MENTANGLKVFKCSLYERGWGTDYLQKREVVLAMSVEEARAKICALWQLRKNAKGLEIEEVPFVNARQIAKSRTELVHSTDYRPGLGTWDSSHYATVTRYYCSKCDKETSATATFCKNCASYFG